MAVPFGFSVGDFLAVGKLIGQVVLELKENHGAAPEFQSLLIELEALNRALSKLYTLRPAKHELFQLTSIRATAQACRKPLEEFLVKISKFEHRLGTLNAPDNRWKGLPRRMQYRLLYLDDVKKLRATLTSHVTTMNLLLMTQTVASITIAEDERHCIAERLEGRILENRQLLANVDSHTVASLQQAQSISKQLDDQNSLLNTLGSQAATTQHQLESQSEFIKVIGVESNEIRRQGLSILAVVTEILSLVTTGVLHLGQITEQLRKMFQLCAHFTAEMRFLVSRHFELFSSIQATLQGISQNFPVRMYLPTVQFTTALGDTMALPYQLCQQWATFSQLLKVIFMGKPGMSRVEQGQFLIRNARGGRLLQERTWQHAVKQDDHLSMSIGLDDLTVRDDHCPFPSCQAPLDNSTPLSGGRLCSSCGRWSTIASLESLAIAARIGPRPPKVSTDRKCTLINEGHVLEEEDIELYRQIHVQASVFLGKQEPVFDDAVNYVRFLREELSNVEEYMLWISLMKDFERKDVNTTDVMQGVTFLFDKKKHLLGPFSDFLPRGYNFIFDDNATLRSFMTPKGAVAPVTKLPDNNEPLTQFMRKVILYRGSGYVTMGKGRDKFHDEGESGHGTYGSVEADIEDSDMDSAGDTEDHDDSEWRLKMNRITMTTLNLMMGRFPMTSQNMTTNQKLATNWEMTAMQGLVTESQTTKHRTVMMEYLKKEQRSGKDKLEAFSHSRRPCMVE